MPPTVDELGLRGLEASRLKTFPGASRAQRRGSTAAPLGIESDRVFRGQGRRFAFRMEQHRGRATGLIGGLPGPGEAVYAIVAASVDGWAFAESMIELGGPIETLKVATLGFNSRNSDSLIGHVDAGRIGDVALIASTYFAADKRDVWPALKSSLEARGMACEAPRNHAKVIAARWTHGRTCVAHGSANLRSCKMAEQVCVEGSPEVYEFFANYVDDAVKACRRGKIR